jgi:hypothetical protein
MFIEDKRLNSNTGKTRKEQQQYRPFLCQTPNFMKWYKSVDNVE